MESLQLGHPLAHHSPSMPRHPSCPHTNSPKAAAQTQGKTCRGKMHPELQLCGQGQLCLSASTRGCRCKVPAVTSPPDLTLWKDSASILTETPELCLAQLDKNTNRDAISTERRGFFSRNLFWNAERPSRADTAPPTAALWVRSVIRGMST